MNPLRKWSVVGAAVVGAGTIAYPIVLVHGDRGMLLLAGLATVALASALVFPRYTVLLGVFCTLWCSQYALGLFAGDIYLDPLAPLMGAGLFVVVELADLGAVASRATIAAEVIRRRVIAIVVVSLVSIFLGTIALVASRLVSGGGMLSLAVSAALAVVILAIPAAAGLSGRRA